jgi:hypothetical protein
VKNDAKTLVPGSTLDVNVPNSKYAPILPDKKAEIVLLVLQFI